MTLRELATVALLVFLAGLIMGFGARDLMGRRVPPTQAEACAAAQRTLQARLQDDRNGDVAEARERVREACEGDPT